MCKKELLIVSAAIVLAVAVMMFFPAIGTAGSLEPTAAPAPTMKTLDQIPPSWSQKLPAAQRFELVLDGVAVLDKETGLVWEKSPSTTKVNWFTAAADVFNSCQNSSVGNRKGWRLPTVAELASLVDPTMVNPSLPSGHLFNNVMTDWYWSGTTHANDTGSALTVHFRAGDVNYMVKNVMSAYVWCVRGGQGYDGQ